MEKLTDFLITAVRYNQNHTHIELLRVHEVDGRSIGFPFAIKREVVLSARKMGFTYNTAYESNNGIYHKGSPVVLEKIL